MERGERIDEVDIAKGIGILFGLWVYRLVRLHLLSQLQT